MRTATSRAGWSGEAGFTLLEALIVLVVLSLAATVTGLAVPRTRERTQFLEAEARLRSILMEARSLARQSASVSRVVFDLDEGKVRMAGSAEWYRLPRQAELSVTSAREIGSPHQPAIAFLPDGTSSGGAITLTLGSHTASHRVEWLTGRIRP